MTILHFTLGPVQGFVAQARRTRDLWAGSFLLSYLTGQAMATVLEHKDANILLPLVDIKDKPDNELLAAILSARAQQSSQHTPFIGSLPNHFKAVIATDNPADALGISKDLANASQTAVKTKWQEIADAVYTTFFEDKKIFNEQQKAIWDAQVQNFWQINWVVGSREDANDKSDAAWLGQRKNWRSYLPSAQAGDKCTLMGQWQELSGYIRAQQKRQDNKQADFWKKLRKDSGIKVLDLGDNERLCAIALIKRLFPYVAQETIGWQLDVQSWPSTSYFAAVPWLRAIQENVTDAEPLRKAAQDYHDLVKQTIKGSSGHNAALTCLESSSLRDFQRLDGQLYYHHSIENDKEHSYNGEAQQAKRTLQAQLDTIAQLVGHRPSPFYALLMMDGDSLGKLLQQEGVEAQDISLALAAFTAEVEPIVRSHCGKTIYAGGDDVLALLPLDRALDAASKLREVYQHAFDQQATCSTATISAGLCFAHYRTSLRAVRKEAKYLLDDVAKDGNGRDSIAVSVLTSSGRNVEWCSSWQDGADDSHICEVLTELVQNFSEDNADDLQALAEDDAEQANNTKNFASTFFYNVRQRFEALTIHQDGTRDNPQIFTDNTAQNLLEDLLVAEYKKSRATDNQRQGKSDEKIRERMQNLLKVCRIRKGNDSRAQMDSLNMQGALLVRFLATKGEGLEA